MKARSEKEIRFQIRMLQNAKAKGIMGSDWLKYFDGAWYFNGDGLPPSGFLIHVQYSARGPQEF